MTGQMRKNKKDHVKFSRNDIEQLVTKIKVPLYPSGLLLTFLTAARHIQWQARQMQKHSQNYQN